MKIRTILAISLVLLPQLAFACRYVDWTHSKRVQHSEIAVTALVSGIAVPALEEKTISAVNAPFIATLSPRVIRLVVTEFHKGTPSTLLELTVSQCKGSLSAEIGHLVYAYKEGSDWRLLPVEDSE